jgi:methanogenic corrinoid protein MtbC1
MGARLEHVAKSADWSANPNLGLASPDQAETAQSIESEVIGAACLAGSRRSALLSRVVASEILPRLAVLRGGPANANPVPLTVTTDDDTRELIRLLLLLREDDSVALFIETLRLRGIAAADLYLGIITAAARRLGEMWEDDLCDFAQVTIGLGRLQQLVRLLSPNFQTTAVHRAHPESVLLLPAPGEQHTFGLVVLAEFFRREGWYVSGGPVSAHAAGGLDAANAVRSTWIDVVGFSIGSAAHVGGLARSIRAVRKASRNRGIAVMVGGPLFLLRPEIAAQVGADLGAIDAPSAVRQARGVLAVREAAD